MLTCTAVSLFNTDESIAQPCSVKAKGKYFIFEPLPVFKVTNCDLEDGEVAICDIMEFVFGEVTNCDITESVSLGAVPKVWSSPYYF